MPEVVYNNADDGEGRGNAKTRREAQRSGGDAAWSRWSRLTAVCEMLLCVLLLTAITVLWINYHILKAENNQLQTSNNTLTRERDQLQTCYNTLTYAQNQLQTSYKNLTIERDQLKNSNNNLTIERDQLKTSNNNLTIERDQLQWEREELERFLKLGWIYSSSSVYIISTEQKSWNESRKNCSERGADLVIINSREEQEFVTKLRDGTQAWIGLSDRVGENKWKWVDDTTLITGFWGSGEPNSKAGDEDCVITGETTDPVNNWGDVTCSKQYKWICEKTIFN